MSDNTRQESGSSDANADNKETPLKTCEKDENAEFKDNNEVESDVLVDSLLNKIVASQSATTNEPNSVTTNETQPIMNTTNDSTTITDDNNQTPAAPQNSSLSLIAQYDSAESSSSDDSDTDSMEVDSADSESSSSESVASAKSLNAIKKKIDEFVDVGDEDDEDDEKKNQTPIKAIGELGIEDLPPIEDLYITVPEKECNLLGKITSIVDQLVLVESLPNVVPLDLDTILFLDKGQRPLGKVFDVMGQVHCPIYCVRFNTNQEIQDKGINVGNEVYCAPAAPCTTFVILPELMKHKGSDASWKNDIEPPTRFIEYSDDEEERSANRVRRNGRETATTTNPTENHHRNGHPGNHTYNRARRGGGNSNRENAHHSSFNYPRPNHHHMPIANHMHHQPQYYYPPPGGSSTVYPNPFAQQQADPRYYVNPFAYAPTVNYPPFNPTMFNGPPPPPPPPSQN